MAPTARIEEIQNLRADRELRERGGAQYEEHVKRVLKAISTAKQYELGRLVEDGTIDALDPYQDTIPYAVALYDYAGAVRNHGSKGFPKQLKPTTPAWERIVTFLQRCNRIEIRAVGRYWSALVLIIIKSAEHAQTDGPRIPVLQYAAAALLHLDPSGSTLTTTHYDLARDASLQHCWRDILPVLDKTPANIPGKTGAQIEGYSWLDEDCPSCVYISSESGFTERLDLQAIQEYFVLGALAYIDARNWRRAIFYLEHVLATPTSNHANGLMVEAYCKWILLHLIENGRVPGMPHTVPQSVMKHIRNVSKPYEALRDAFGRGDGTKLLAEAMEGDNDEKVWRRDGNTGLVQRVLAEHKRRRVLKLESVYVAVPLETVAERLRMSESQTQQYLAHLIQEGAINAKLEQPPDSHAVLRFNEDADDEGSAEYEEELRAQLIERTKRLKELTAAIRIADEQLSMTKAYVEHERKARKNKAERQGPSGGDDAQMDIAPNAMQSDNDDEELMADAI